MPYRSGPPGTNPTGRYAESRLKAKRSPSDSSVTAKRVRRTFLGHKEWFCAASCRINRDETGNDKTCIDTFAFDHGLSIPPDANLDGLPRTWCFDECSSRQNTTKNIYLLSLWSYPAANPNPSPPARTLKIAPPTRQHQKG